MNEVMHTAEISLQHESENDGGGYECVFVSYPSSFADIHNGSIIRRRVEIIEDTVAIPFGIYQ